MSIFDDLDTAALRDSTLDRLRRLVELESPSSDEVRLRAVAGDFAAELAGAGAEVETVDVEGVGEHVIGRIAGGGAVGAAGDVAVAAGAAGGVGEAGAAGADLEPILILGHLDTVHPVGTFDPVFRTGDGRATGPGVFDMKGGWACVLEALSRLHAAGARPRRPVVVLATCDEETGSETSRGLIEELAAGARAVLVPEPPLPGGVAKTRRKGVGWYRLTVRGRASHAGLAPEKGVNAIVELANQILAITGLADAAAGTTVSVGETGGGTASNVVPDRAWAVVDVRFATMAEAERVDAAMRALSPGLEGARLELDGGINRPPMERTDGIVELFEHARELAAEDGWTLEEGVSGGASDGSLTAGMGIPTLDGIGVDGDGAHASHEHVLIDDLPRRVRLYGRLLETL